MPDIDYFSEEKMCVSSFNAFKNSLPPNLKSKFCKSFKGYEYLGGDVLQGYTGPSQSSYNGVKQISYWYGMSKHMNWIPVVGTLVWGSRKIADNFSGAHDWRYLYFDALTGEMLEDVDDAREFDRKTKKAEECYNKGEVLYQEGKYDEAYQEFKIGLENCNDANKSKFTDAMNKSLIHNATYLYESADRLRETQKLNEALEMYKQAEALSHDLEQKEQGRDKQATILKMIGDQLRSDNLLEEAMQKYTEANHLANSTEMKREIDDSIALVYTKQGEHLFEQGKYKEACLKFEQASVKTTIDKESINIWLKRIENEIEAATVKDRADFLVSIQQYDQAILQYQIAAQKTSVDQKKFQALIKDTQLKIANSKKTTESKQNDKSKAFDLVYKGLELLCEGNLSKTDENFGQACNKYDEAGLLFENAAKLCPLNIIFNSILKLIDAYDKIQDFDLAYKLIQKDESLFSNKLEDFDEIKKTISSRNCSLDYLKRFMMEEERSGENVRNITQNLSFSR